MIITCNKCDTKYKLKKTVSIKENAKAKCVKCGNVFPVLASTSVSKSSQPINITGLENVKPELNAKVVSVCNQKGGVAKTTTCLNLAVSLRLLKKRVLVIDFDIQANLTLLMGNKDSESFFDLLQSEDQLISKYIVKSNHGIWLLPSNNKMALLAKKHIQDDNFEYLLRDQLKYIKPYFDYILIDTPPSGDFYTLNALLTSDIAIIPSPAEYLAMSGVNHIVNMIEVIAQKSSHKIDYKIPITMFEPDNTAAQVVLKKIRQEYKSHVFDTVIEKDQKIQESQIVNKPTIIYDKESKAGRQYYSLANEVLGM